MSSTRSRGFKSNVVLSTDKEILLSALAHVEKWHLLHAYPKYCKLKKRVFFLIDHNWLLLLAPDML